MKEEKDLVEVPEIDAFTAFMKRAADYVRENRKNVILGIAGFFVVLALISSIPALIKAKREKSFTELQKALRVIEADNSTEPAQIEKAFSVLNEKYSGTKASALGDIYIARAMHELGEDEKAAEYFKKSVDYFGESSLPGRLSMYELGCLYFDKSPEKAQSYLEPLAETESFVREDALFYLALAGDMQSLETLKSDYPEGFYSEIVRENFNSSKDQSVKN
jgi:predicted negative regulator of RcsB-dependent stress response